MARKRKRKGLTKRIKRWFEGSVKVDSFGSKKLPLPDLIEQLEYKEMDKAFKKLKL